MFYAKLKTDLDKGINRELILKVFHESDESDKKAFYKEVEFFKAIMEYQNKFVARGVNPNSIYGDEPNDVNICHQQQSLTWLQGFPRVISFIDGHD